MPLPELVGVRQRARVDTRFAFLENAGRAASRAAVDSAGLSTKERV
jgi:hypothetical protein